MVQERQLTPLHTAVLSGDLEEVQALLAAGAVDLEATTAPTGYTPLLYAARRGLVELLPALVQAGADTRARTTRGSTVLHLAAASQHGPTVAYLAGLPGADLLATNRRRQTPLDIAAANTQKARFDLPVMHAVKALLDALAARAATAADAKAIQEVAASAAQEACNAGNLDVATLLLRIAGPAGASLSLQEAREHDNEEVAFDAVVAAWQHAWTQSHDVRVLQRERDELAAARRSFQGLICQAAGIIRQAQQVQQSQTQQQQQPGGPAPPEHAAAAAAAAASVADAAGAGKRKKKRKQGSSDDQQQQQQQAGAATPPKKHKRQKKLKPAAAS